MNATYPHPAATSIIIQTADVDLNAELTLTRGAMGLVIFAHGDGGSFGAGNRCVATALQRAGLATLVFDLLTADEHTIDELTRELRFDISLLAQRLVDSVDWLQRQPRTQSLRVGLFGAGTGAAAALVAAAERPFEVAAIVARGARPDLAAAQLPRVQAPTLLIVGGLEDPVVSMNRQAATALHCEHELRVVPVATHSFATPGTLQTVAELARTWFVDHLG